MFTLNFGFFNHMVSTLSTNDIAVLYYSPFILKTEIATIYPDVIVSNLTGEILLDGDSPLDYVDHLPAMLNAHKNEIMAMEGGAF